MAVIEIAKIQVRRGQENLTGIPQLAPGEFGWAEDTENLSILEGPEAAAKAREIRQQLEQRAEEAIKPLEQQRQMLLNQLGMANWGQVSVKPNR